MKMYINRRGQGQLETVDELDVKTREDRKELRRLVGEYQMSDRSAEHYASSRACADWKKRSGNPTKKAEMLKRSGNPAKRAPVDVQAKRELQLFLDKDPRMNSRKTEFLNVAAKKMRAGKYDHTLAGKLWLYWVNEGAKKYSSDYGSGAMSNIFSPATREAVASDVARREYDALANGEYRAISTVHAKRAPVHSDMSPEMERKLQMFDLSMGTGPYAAEFAARTGPYAGRPAAPSKRKKRLGNPAKKRSLHDQMHSKSYVTRTLPSYGPPRLVKGPISWQKLSPSDRLAIQMQHGNHYNLSGYWALYKHSAQAGGMSSWVRTGAKL